MKLKNSELFREQCYIDGQWCDADSGATSEVTNPASGEVIGTIPNMGAAETDRAIAAADAAFAGWRARTAKDRANVLKKWFDLIITNADDLAIIMTTEQGKPLAEAKGEIMYGASFIEWFAEEGRRAYGDMIPAHMPDKRILVMNQPIGVVALLGGHNDGQWCDADSGATSEVTNPASGEVIGTIPNMGAAETDRAIAAADAAFAGWRARTAKDRANVLKKWFDLIITNADDLAIIMTTEQGKPLAEAKGEIMYGASFIEWFAEEGRRAYGDMIPAHMPDKRILVMKQPIGVVASITPWNFPSAMLTRKAAPALAAGCPVVAKPAHETPYSALALAVLADEAGLPAGLFNVITGKALVIGKAMTDSPIVQKLTFTGSTEVGRILMRQCADSIKKVGLELGGNAPFIVFDDADIDAAVDGAIMCKYRNTGQTCVCANRIYVQGPVYDAFLEKFVAKVGEIKVGDGMTKGTTLGPLITALAVLADEAGLPAGLFNVITGKALVIGKAMTDSPIVQKLTFTGSTEVGRILMRQCADSIKKVGLELGGNAPFIVFDDADIDAAVDGAIMCKYRNTGQTCVCANRIYVQGPVYDAFLEKFVAKVGEIKVGDGMTKGTTLGPLITDAAVAKVEEHVADAIKKGGKVLVGGKRHELGGKFFEPTVISEATNDMLCATEETFGPMAPIFRFETEEEVIERANDTPFGLAAYFYARDVGRIFRVSEALESGIVGVNTGIISTEVAPFGGVKQSGIGREGSKYGLEDFLEIKYVCLGI